MSPNQEFVKEVIALVERWASAVSDQLGQQGLVVHAFDIKSALYELCDKHKEPAKMEAALQRIVAESHSWVITQETGAIVKPIHDKYREIAKEGLS